jgi:hypothetical protein
MGNNWYIKMTEDNKDWLADFIYDEWLCGPMIDAIILKYGIEKLKKSIKDYPFYYYGINSVGRICVLYSNPEVFNSITSETSSPSIEVFTLSEIRKYNGK